MEENMSRTYRKNRRYIVKFDGELINPYDDKIANGYWQYASRHDFCLGASIVYKEMIVPDVNNHGLRIGGKEKQRLSQQDRARYKAAMIRDPENIWINPSFDPWNYT
jgi:hypothetical protein